MVINLSKEEVLLIKTSLMKTSIELSRNNMRDKSDKIADLLSKFLSFEN